MKTGFAVAIVVLIAAMLACASPAGLPIPTPSPTPLPTPLDLMAEGDAALEAGDLEEAVHLYNRALDADPDNWRASVGLATAFYYQAQYENARRILQDDNVALHILRNAQALEILGRTNLALYYYRSNVAPGETLLQEAKDAFEQWSVLVTDDPEPYAYLAWIAYIQSDTSALARQLARAEGMAQESPIIYIVRAFQAEDREDYVSEVEHGERAWGLLEEESLTGFERIVCARIVGYAYAMQKNYQVALEWGLRELDAGPAQRGANSNVAWWYAAIEQCERAQPYIEREIELYSNNPWPYYTRYFCASRAGDQATAFAA